MRLLPAGLFLVGFVAVPVRALGGLQSLPGDLGDSRLNAFFLENIYQFLVGGSPSLWHLGIFAPFPYTGGFSDNLFGAAPVYLLARVLTGDANHAFALWWYAGWIANFAAAYVALRWLSLKRVGASVGAWVFTFALPVAGTTFNWVQLDYRFGLPLAVATTVLFVRTRSWPQLVASTAWVVWQFYCTIYLGVFTLVLIAAVLLAHLVVSWVRSRFTASPRRLLAALDRYRLSLLELGVRGIALCGVALAGLAGALALLFYPYIQVSSLYRFQRRWEDVIPLLPAAADYLSSHYSWLWSWAAGDQGAWVEHQIFIGALPLGLALLGLLLVKTPRDLSITVALALLIVFGATLSVQGASLWYYLSGLPLVSAIRAISRIVLAMLFPVGYLAGRAADTLLASRTTWRRVAAWSLVAGMVLESVLVSPPTTSDSDWRARAAAADARVPGGAPDDAILFFAQTEDDDVAHVELDAMGAAMQAHRPTMNGYSGWLPPGYAASFGTSCAEVPMRAEAYLKFVGKADDATAYRQLMARIVPIGFSDCDRSWWTALPLGTYSNADVPLGDLTKIDLTNGSAHRAPDGWVSASVRVTNGTHDTLPVASPHPVHIAWRYLDASGADVSGWNGRTVFPFDVPAGASLTLSLGLDQAWPRPGGSLDVVVMQEGLAIGSEALATMIRIPIRD